MKLIANEVGVFKARFMGFKSCQNVAYVMVRLQFAELEVQGDISPSLPAQTAMILHEATNMQVFHGISEGQLCHLKMSVGYQAPNTRGDKSYPGGVKFKILQCAAIKEG